jgi:hypothetical protein
MRQMIKVEEPGARIANIDEHAPKGGHFPLTGTRGPLGIPSWLQRAFGWEKLIFDEKMATPFLGPCVIESEGHALMMAEIGGGGWRAYVPYIFKASYDKAIAVRLRVSGAGIEEWLKFWQN